MAESSLSPREIQARVRAGASVAEVAEAAGVDPEHVEPFAAPVLAERSYVVSTALDFPVRRRGEPSSGRTLRQVVSDRLKAHLVPFNDVQFDAWRDDDRRWHISARYVVAGEDRMAELLFDPRARFSIPGNDEGRWLVGEQPPAVVPKPSDPDSEPTVDLNDEWAIVRAVQEGTTVDEVDEPLPSVRISSPASASRSHGGDPPDYSPAQLEQVDGIYDIVPNESDMDVLYEMLAGFNEDSVKIYAGLTQPITDRDATVPAVAESGGSVESVEIVTIETTVETSVETTYQEIVTPGQATEPTDRVRRPRAGGSKASSAKVDRSRDGSSPGTTPGRVGGTKSAAEPVTPDTAEERALAPHRHSDDPEPPSTSPRGRKKGRAQVPSWDEIMFGGPASTPPES